MLYLLAAVLTMMVWAAVKRPRAVPVQDGAVLMAFSEDDSDIKIAGREAKARPEEEAAREAAELAHYKQTGDVEKARALGGSLARLVMSEDIAGYCGGSAAGRVHLHCRLVLSCAVQCALKTRLPGTVLAGVANGAFTETLEREYPNFYKQLIGSGALSFYTLSLRDPGDPMGELGRTYAKMTNREGDAAAVEDGTQLFDTFLKKVEQAVETCRLGR